MPGRYRRIGRLVAGFAAFVSLGAVTPPALAYHTDKTRLTDGTAYTLGQSRWKLGLWTAEVGAHPRLDFSTYWLPWVFQVANLGVKYQLPLTERLSIGPRLHVFHLDVQNLNPDAQEVKISAIPFELAGSYRFDRSTLSLQAIYTYLRVVGSLEEDALQGAAAVSNLQLVSTFEVHWTKVARILLRVRYLAHQWQPSASAVYVLHPDEYTTVEVHGAAELEAIDVKNAYSIVPGLAFSWKTFNLRAGLGYGNFNVGGVNFVFPRKTIVPELDLFWRW